MVDTIIEGKVVQHHITIPEGLTSEQIVPRLLENDDAHREHQGDPARGHAAAGNLPVHPRHHARADDPAHAAGAAARAPGDLGAPQADLPVKTPEQLVTLASIIEKETGSAEERTRVAAVFVNRLKQKMKLQSDPTIIYGLVGGKGTLGRPIMRSEIEQPTPYNTYVIDGLPPGPIANPGRASLEAAANPARTKELFFVADGTGGHAFAENYDQHQKNVARLRAIEQQARTPPRRAGAHAGNCSLGIRRHRLFAARGRSGCPAGRDTGARYAASARAAGPHAHPSAIMFNGSAGGLWRCASAVKFQPISRVTLSTLRVSPDGAVEHDRLCARHGVSGTYAWAWELKSVNAKGLDLRLRLPSGWDAIETRCARAPPRCCRAAPCSPTSSVTARGRGAGGAHQRAGARRRAGDGARVWPAGSRRAADARRHPRLKGVMEVSERRRARRSAAPPKRR